MHHLNGSDTAELHTEPDRFPDGLGLDGCHGNRQSIDGAGGSHRHIWEAGIVIYEIVGIDIALDFEHNLVPCMYPAANAQGYTCTVHV